MRDEVIGAVVKELLHGQVRRRRRPPHVLRSRVASLTAPNIRKDNECQRQNSYHQPRSHSHQKRHAPATSLVPGCCSLVQDRRRAGDEPKDLSEGHSGLAGAEVSVGAAPGPAWPVDLDLATLAARRSDLAIHALSATIRRQAQRVLLDMALHQGKYKTAAAKTTSYHFAKARVASSKPSGAGADEEEIEEPHHRDEEVDQPRRPPVIRCSPDFSRQRERLDPDGEAQGDSDRSRAEAHDVVDVAPFRPPTAYRAAADGVAALPKASRGVEEAPSHRAYPVAANEAEG
ncbi:MAG: hypothetical protein M3285_02865 [Actinomycetota bacterium]|nr:hypothetical protein [Actinomycetota bacterium]